MTKESREMTESWRGASSPPREASGNGERLIYPPITYVPELPGCAKSLKASLRPDFYKENPPHYDCVNDPLLAEAFRALSLALRDLGNDVVEVPDGATDMIMTGLPFGCPVDLSRSLLVRARPKWRLPKEKQPTIVTLVSMSEGEFEGALETFAHLARASREDSRRFSMKGLPETAVGVLQRESRRYGPMGGLERMLQGQSKSIMVLGVVGDRASGGIEEMWLFDLAGAKFRVAFEDPEAAAKEIVGRLMMRESSHEVREHAYVDEPVPPPVWERSGTIEAMIGVGRFFGERGLLTEPFRISEVVGGGHIGKAIESGVSSQYSAGCYAAWDETVKAMVVTGTGSARIIDKRNITQNDLAVVKGINADGSGAVVRPVEGRDPVIPSVEAVEMCGIIQNGIEIHGETVFAAVFHTHAGVLAYNPDRVERVCMDPTHYFYPYTCGTDGLARATWEAFGKSDVLNDLADPREVVFAQQVGHGVVVVAKKSHDGAFAPIMNAVQEGDLVLDFKAVPQGREVWERGGIWTRLLHEETGHQR
jgi:hypothetical protein